MAISKVKRKILDAVQNLPDDVTFEDAIEHLVFLAKVEQGLTQADAGETVTHTEAKNRLMQ
jgi:predicted transcriptional regulator